MPGRAERHRTVRVNVDPGTAGALWPEGRFDTPIRRALAALGDGGDEPAHVAASVVCALDPMAVPEVEPLIHARAARVPDRTPAFGSKGPSPIAEHPLPAKARRESFERARAARYGRYRRPPGGRYSSGSSNVM